jgi:hypothetical protein
MEWRYEKPANDPKKPLVSAEGFKAMNISLLERKTGFVLYISIPPPKQDDAVSLIKPFYGVIAHRQLDLGYWRG